MFKNRLTDLRPSSLSRNNSNSYSVPSKNSKDSGFTFIISSLTTAINSNLQKLKNSIANSKILSKRLKMESSSNYKSISEALSSITTETTSISTSTTELITFLLKLKKKMKDKKHSLNTKISILPELKNSLKSTSNSALYNDLANIESISTSDLPSKIEIISSLESSFNGKLIEEINNYTNISETIRDEIHSKMKSSIDNKLTYNLNENELNSIEQDPAQFIRQSLMLNAEINEETNDEINRIEEKHRDILKIEKGIERIKELFDNLNFLVQESGKTVDNIEDYIGMSKSNVEGGEARLRKAKNMGKAGWWVIGGVGGCVIVVGIIIMVKM